MDLERVRVWGVVSWNLWILELVGNKLKDWNIEDYINIPQGLNLLLQEVINPGFMNGYGGIVYYYIKSCPKN